MRGAGGKFCRMASAMHASVARARAAQATNAAACAMVLRIEWIMFGGSFVRLMRLCARFGRVGNTFFAKFFSLLYSVGNEGFRFRGFSGNPSLLSLYIKQNCVFTLFLFHSPRTFLGYSLNLFYLVIEWILFDLNELWLFY